MTEPYAQIDFFRDESLVEDPYPFFRYLREQCPVVREPHHGVMMVTGYAEAVEIYNDPARFSSCNSVTGPFPGFPVPLEGDDVSELIEQHRAELPMGDQIITFDPPTHTDHRALLMRLITPKRLAENEGFMWRLADRQIDTFHSLGSCEFIADFATPFALLVIADLLGVPEEDHALFIQRLHRRGGSDQTVGSTGDDALAQNPLQFLYEQFTRYVVERRREPRGDVLTGLATATFPDGTVPDPLDVARIASNLFAAGQETTVRLLGATVQLMAERHDLQTLLRGDRSRIPNFVEETLRTESPVKGDFRLAQVTTTVGGVEVPAGTTLMVLNGAANRDPGRFIDPDTFDPNRPEARQHIAFGRGVHTCPGAPLARAEARVSLERLLDRLGDIEISEAVHGPADARRYRYAPTYILRGLAELHIEFTPVA